MPKLPENTKRKFYYYIYKITFLCGEPEGRYYYGKRTYCGVDAANDKYHGSGSFCKNYFRKYGCIKDVTYTIEIIEFNKNKQENNNREIVVIGDLWKTDPLCMNMCPGGFCDGDWNISTRQKISRKLLGNTNGLGVKKTDWEKQHLKEILGKRVLQYDMDGNLLYTYASLHDAARAVNGIPICISDCCNKNNRSTAYNYIWRFETNPLQLGEAKLITRKYSRIVVQLDLDGNIIEYYGSIVLAAKAIGVKPCTISCAISRNSIVSGKYYWKYMEDVKNA